ncbi:MAG: lysine-sensitive aspartokinase 3 [Ruminobacter sp.]|nr:lysine-sensitive aspartokinase 3 [Ruminobacter sp.]
MTQVCVAKFGGTSVANYQAMCNCAKVVTSNPNTKLVVLSASAGVTNLLVELASGNLDKATIEERMGKLCDIQFSILNDLGRPAEITAEIEKLLHEIRDLANHALIEHDDALTDRIVSYGEIMSTKLFTEVLKKLGHKSQWFDVRSVMRTDSRFGKATPILEVLSSSAKEKLAPLVQESIVVTQGFIGSNAMGQTTTLGRGGSDYSAALLGEALPNCAAIQIWTDVPGIYTTDPRLVPEAHAIPEISFSEAAEMATFGAKVLHPATIFPAVRRDIPVFVGSSKQPELGGTWVRSKTNSRPTFRAVALRRNQILLTLQSPNMIGACGFLANIFSIFAKYGISVDLITTSEVSVSLTIDYTGSQSNGQSVLNEKLLEELKAFCKVRIDEGLALIALIGNGMSQVSGTGAAVFSSICDVNIRMICYGASSHNLCFLVNEDQAEQTIKQLHHKLLEACPEIIK